jgi:hypothetical protein
MCDGTDLKTKYATCSIESVGIAREHGSLEFRHLLFHQHGVLCANKPGLGEEWANSDNVTQVTHVHMYIYYTHYIYTTYTP